MNDYANELSEATSLGVEAYKAISAWLDRPPSRTEQVPTAELERKVKQLRASRARLLALKKAYGDESDIVAAIAANTAYFRKVGVSLPEDE